MKLAVVQVRATLPKLGCCFKKHECVQTFHPSPFFSKGGEGGTPGRLPEELGPLAIGTQTLLFVMKEMWSEIMAKQPLSPFLYTARPQWKTETRHGWPKTSGARIRAARYLG